MNRAFLMLVLLTAGCTTTTKPVWNTFELRQAGLASSKQDLDGLRVRIEFTKEPQQVLADAATNLPGNSFDVYTNEAIEITHRKGSEYEIIVPSYRALGPYMFLRIHWRTKKDIQNRELHIAFKNGVVVESREELIYIDPFILLPPR